MKLVRNPLAIGAIVLFGVLLALVCGVVPFHDDWTYATAPNVAFEWAQLLPRDSFWRPFDVLWGALMGTCPAAWPIANRVVIVLGHCVNAALLFSVLGKIGKNGFPRWLATVFFAVSSAVAATVVNTDTINQVWSFTFGLFALRAALADRNSLAFVLMFISILFKESGVSWLAVVPVVRYEAGKGSFDWQKIVKSAGVGAMVLGGYFALRFALRGGVALGDSYYRLGFDPVSIVKNLAIAIMVPLSGADFLAFTGSDYLFFVLTLVFGGAFWVLVLVSSWDKMVVRSFGFSIILFSFLAVALAIPHCCFVGHHPAEMHFYPVLFAGAWLISRQDFSCWSRGRSFVSVGIFVILNLLVWGDKLSAVYESSHRTKCLMAELEAMQLDYSKSVYFVLNPPVFCSGADGTVASAPVPYSVFSQSAAHGVDFGRACRKFNGWRDFDCHVVEGECSVPDGVQTVFLSR